MRRRLQAGAAAILLSVAVLGGCGGGGDSADETASTTPATSTPTPTGAASAQSAVLALAALGSPAAVDPSEEDGTLASLDEFGVPHDLFKAQVTEAATPPAAVPGATTTTPVPVTVPTPGPTYPTYPTYPVGTTVPGTTTTAPATTVPNTTTAPTTTTSGVATKEAQLVASLSISGEGLLANVGDAVPRDSQELVVAEIEDGQVVLKLVRGLLTSGSDRVTLRVGQSVTLTDALGGRTYTVKLLEVRAQTA